MIEQTENLQLRIAELEKKLAENKRELEIEAALEQVRAKAMAMQKSEELVVLIDTVQKELTKLEFTLNNCIFWIMNEEPPSATWWVGPVHKTRLPESYLVPFANLPLFNLSLEAWKERMPKWIYELKGQDKKATDQYIFTKTDLSRFPEVVKGAFKESEKVYLSFSFYNYGGLHLSTPELLHEDQLEILNRFSKVFDQTYTRFLDLQKAEAQAREAQIEAAMKRVRARTMAMQKSSELEDVATILFRQVRELGIKTWATGFNVWSEDNNFYEDYLIGPEGGFIEPYTIDARAFSQFQALSNAKKSGKDFFILYQEGETLKETYRQLSKFADKNQFGKLTEAGFQFPQQQYVHLSFGARASLMFITYEPVPEAHNVFKRFGKVFEQIYTRFLDLQKAETQAREAWIEAALEKVRSRSLAMHRSDELKEVVAILFEKLRELGLQFDGGAAIHLFTKGSKDATILVAAPNLASPVQINLPYDEKAFVNNPIIIDVWKAKETGEPILNKYYSFEEKNVYFNYVFKYNDFTIMPEALREDLRNKDSYTATFISEKNSLLGANSWTGQKFSEKDFEVLKRFARVFEQAYVRFMDLQKAEAQAIQAEQDLIEIKAARKKAEDTLAALKATQQQLIHSEKMASLGELTAGIAHEIQNPLNFVNNFSETNVELLEEAEQELNNDHFDEVKAMIADAKENEKKINHHGKRADAIVKAMMQHARTSTGEKQPTNLKALVDEYLRLAYHGFRAKDKNFNAIMKTNFDDSIGKVNIVPQEIGRVLLNLFNNAFYAVKEKKNNISDEYEPTVEVSTNRRSDKIEISVWDNGSGIPQQVVEKVFQPFFTTKPTGQGTGLGLSLSYDIIKAHGGTIKVVCKDGQGTAFIVSLPA